MHIYHKNITIYYPYFISYKSTIMKKIRLLSLLWVIVLAWALAGCWNNDKEINNDNSDLIIEDVSSESEAVINYNDTLVDLASQCIISENEIWSNYDDESPIEDIQAAINNTINQCNNAKENINKLWDWEWDSSLKDGVSAIIEKEIAYYSKFSEMLPYLWKEELTEEENKIYESIFAEIETLDQELAAANDNLINIQEQFAKDHDFELESEPEIAE